MRRWTLIALLLALAAAPAHAKREYLKVVVAEPFIEMRTGPGEGYPVVQVADRGAEILVLKRRTDWFKVRTDRDIEGWVREDQLSQTMQAGGEPVVVDDPGWEDYAGRRWETAISLGDFDGATSISLTGAWRTSANLAVELLAAQISGDFSDGWMAGVRLVHTPFPEWRVAPYLVLGTGVVVTDVATAERMEHSAIFQGP